LLKAGKDNPVDLKGIAIGNGYIDPWAQSGTELEMMVSANIWKETSNVGIIECYGLAVTKYSHS
jgi:hypothetical protein